MYFKIYSFRRRLMFTLLLLFTGLYNYSQTLTGKVMDEQNKPVIYANVVLLTMPDSSFIAGVITDEHGTFAFSDVGQRNKLLQVSFIGYETLHISCRTGDLGTLTMQTSALLLNETVVTGRVPAITMKNNTLVTTVENTMLSSVGTASDVLMQIPELRVNREEIEVFGKGKPLIYINGRLVRDNFELSQLDSKDIKSVEMINNPGAEYDATVKAVIKIKTIRPAGEGIGGSVRLFGERGEKWSHGEQVNLKYRKGGLDVFGYVNYSKIRRNQEQRDKETGYTTPAWNILDTLQIHDHDKNLTARSGLNYVVNENNSFGATYTFRKTRSNSESSTNYHVFNDNDLYDNIIYQNFQHGDNRSHYVNVYYTGQIGKKLGIDFNFDFLSGDNNKNQDITEESFTQADRTVHTLSEAENNMYAEKLILSYPVASGNFQLGADGNTIDRDDSYFNEENIVPDTDSKVKEKRIATFAAYDRMFGKVSMQAGLRYEHLDFAYYDEGVKQDEQSRNYNDLFPNMALSFPVNRLNLSLSYTAKTERPSFWQLRGDIQYNSRYLYETGNPLLKPQKMHDVTLMAGYEFVQFSASYQYIKDFIGHVFKPYPDDESISLFMSENFDRAQKITAFLGVSPKIGPWQLRYAVGMEKPFFKAEHRGEIKKFDQPVVSVTLNNNLRLPRGFIFTLNGDYRSEGHYSNIRLKQSGGLDAGLRNSLFNKALDINLQAYDIFKTQRNSFVVYGEVKTFDKWNYADTRQIRLTATWRFNVSGNKYKGTGAAEDEMNRF